jgi:hypothetical protein
VPEEVPIERITAVLDANAFLDLCSIHDLSRAKPEATEKREARARDALLLGICLHEMRAWTYSLRETVDVLARLVPTDSGGLEEQFLKVFFGFVHPETLSGWSVGCADVNDRGNAADRLLMTKALEYGKPLITHDGKLTTRARAAGVEVFSPRKFFTGRLRPGAERRFLSRLKARAPAFARSKRQSTLWARELEGLFVHYRYLLLGRVRLP